MKIITSIIGSQWGDEGKGKVINYFAPNYDWVIRYSGGANAGHTIYIDDKKYVNHLLPSIDPRTSSRGFLGPGMVIDVDQLSKEILSLETCFPDIAMKIFVDPEVFLVLPWHKQEDVLLEKLRKNPIGTTKTGIGPAYTDKTSRDGIRIRDIINDDLLDKLENIYVLKNNLYQTTMSPDPETLCRNLKNTVKSIRKKGVRFLSALELKNDFNRSAILMEGAQGALLDLEYGTYPYVTSSSGITGGTKSIGLPNDSIDQTYGVIKAYTTRVGGGPFPTEENGVLGEKIRKNGKEFGATTGRSRRVGWLDLPALKYVASRNKISNWIITKVDVLNDFDEIKICTQYKIDGVLKSAPISPSDFLMAEPQYVTFNGWKTYKDDIFKTYTDLIKSQTGISVKHVSYGPKTEDIILWKN